jgi:hypothetical protein
LSKHNYIECPSRLKEHSEPIREATTSMKAKINSISIGKDKKELCHGSLFKMKNWGED